MEEVGQRREAALLGGPPRGKFTPAELLKKLTSGGVKQWQPYFTATIKPECGGLCVLECKASKRLQAIAR